MKKMGILGPRGTHSEAAACYLNGVLETPCEMVEYGETRQVLDDPKEEYTRTLMSAVPRLRR